VARATWLALLACVASTGCARSAPPSRFPDAASLLSRLREQQSCSRGLSGEGKLDYFGKEGRIRGTVLFMGASPDSVRLDVVSPFGATISTLTSNGKDFSLYDLRQKVFLHGPANACNLGRFTHVPMPPHALVSLLRGEPPVLVHDAPAATLAWEGGQYVVRIASKHSATQEIAISPADADYDKPFAQQRVSLSSVEVRQQNYVLYRAELEQHDPAATAPPRSDPDGIDPDVPPSGPECRAALPRRLHLEVPAEEQDLVLSISEIAHNPPLKAGAFEQTPPGGVVVRSSPCQ
jgi:outer membrane lipoprotein-sorting protein